MRLSRRTILFLMGGLAALGLATAQAEERAEERAGFAGFPILGELEAPERFQAFRDFWNGSAAPGAAFVTIHALLDSPSVAAAFTFKITKGETTESEVSSRLYPRVDIATAGIAPGTSMFLFNDINRTRFNDIREAVHDSDGLFMRNGAGKTLWRPLANPHAVEVSALADRGPRGFGLMRQPGDYNDLVAHCERRPSLWATGGGGR